MNLIGRKRPRRLCDTGDWSKKSAMRPGTGTVNTAASGEAGYTSHSAASRLEARPRGFLRAHLLERNHWWRGIPPDARHRRRAAVADMSSNIMSRPIDVAKYGLIYAGAQKNIGPPGLTIVIVRDDRWPCAAHHPVGLQLPDAGRNDSMYNTPPTYAIYIAGPGVAHIGTMGGLAAMEAHNRKAKAAGALRLPDASGFHSNRWPRPTAR